MNDYNIGSKIWKALGKTDSVLDLMVLNISVNAKCYEIILMVLCCFISSKISFSLQVNLLSIAYSMNLYINKLSMMMDHFK